MTTFITAICICWLFIALRTAHSSLLALPDASDADEPYTLWIDAGTPQPPLEPPPVRCVYRQEDLPKEGSVLRLSTSVEVVADLPARLVACGHSFVSVLPRPSSNIMDTRAETFLRRVVRIDKANNILSNVAFADDRCVWFNVEDLDLPRGQGELFLGMAKARKAHALPIHLRDGQSDQGRTLVRARGSYENVLAILGAQWAGARIKAGLLFFFIFVLNVGPMFGLVHETTRGLSTICLALGSAARIMLALRRGFGWMSWLVDWVVAPLMAWALARRIFRSMNEIHRPDGLEPLTLATSASPMEPRSASGRGSELLGFQKGAGSALELEHKILGMKSKSRGYGHLIDRWILNLPALRARRWRWVASVRWLRENGVKSALSFPCSIDPIVLGTEIEEVCFVGVDRDALRATESSVPHATRIVGGIDELPNTRFDTVIYQDMIEDIGDVETRRHLEKIKKRLKPNGHVLTSVACDHIHRKFLAHWLGISPRFKSPDQLIAQLDATGYRVTSMDHDPRGIQWLILATPIREI